jgi:hypothetical protein
MRRIESALDSVNRLYPLVFRPEGQHVSGNFNRRCTVAKETPYRVKEMT